MKNVAQSLYLSIIEYRLLGSISRHRLEERTPPSLLPLLDLIMDEYMGEILREKPDGSLECRLCGRVFTSKRGFYLHVQRNHAEEARGILEQILREAAETLRRAP